MHGHLLLYDRGSNDCHAVHFLLRPGLQQSRTPVVLLDIYQHRALLRARCLRSITLGRLHLLGGR